jgi:hypothetical protein
MRYNDCTLHLGLRERERERERENTIACGCCYTIGCWAAPQLLQTLSISTVNPKPQACCTHCPHQPLECLWRVSSSVCWCTTSSMYVVRQIPSLRKLTTPHHGQHHSGLLQILIQDLLSCEKDFWMYNYPFDKWFCFEVSGRDGVRKRIGVKKERAHTKIDLSVSFFTKAPQEPCPRFTLH